MLGLHTSSFPVWRVKSGFPTKVGASSEWVDLVSSNPQAFVPGVGGVWRSPCPVLLDLHLGPEQLSGL